jgi:hypothetical protein
VALKGRPVNPVQEADDMAPANASRHASHELVVQSLRWDVASDASASAFPSSRTAARVTVAGHRQSVEVEPCGAVDKRSRAAAANTIRVEAFKINHQPTEANQDVRSLAASRSSPVD